jgi:2-iminobutanoate/2-iminopropanoate deaminase
MTIAKEAKNFGMSWEKEYGYAQSVKVGDTIYISGQVSHNEAGKIVGHGNMETQIASSIY